MLYVFWWMRTADALAAIQLHHQCSQRAALDLALAAYAEALPESAAMIECE